MTDPNRLNPMPGDQGAMTREAVARFLQDMRHITGVTGQEDLVLVGLVAICAFSEASGHDMPFVVKRLLETLSSDRQQRRS